MKSSLVTSLLSSVLVVSLSLGCVGPAAPSTKSASTASAPDDHASADKKVGEKAPPVFVAPLELAENDGHVVASVRADGAFLDTQGNVFGTFDGRTLTLKDMQLVVNDDGSIDKVQNGVAQDHDASGSTWTFDAHGDLAFSDGEKFTVTDDGALVYVKPNAPPEPFPAHVEGITPATHRLATLFSVVVFMLSAKSSS